MLEHGEQYLDGSWKIGNPIWKWYFFHSYPLLVFLGGLLAFLTIVYFWRRQKYSWANLSLLLIITLPVSFISAKLYTLIFDGGWDNWLDFSGLSIYGGVIGAIIAGSIFLKFRKFSLDFRTVFGITLAPMLLGQAIGRWGNFTNHEIYGHIVSFDSLSWMGALRSHMFIEHAYHAPIFLYEFIGNILGYLIIVWILMDRGYVKPGVPGALYFIFYGFTRAILQTQREAGPNHKNTSYIWGTETPLNLVMSIIFILIGIFLTIMWELEIEWKFKTKKGKTITLWPRQNYEIIHAPKTVRRFWIGKKYERVFKIFIRDYDTKWSKRDLNRGFKL